MIEIIERYRLDVEEDEDGDIFATCEVFPDLIGYGEDEYQAAEDLADEISDYLRRVVIH